MEQHSFDNVVIGGGTGGYVAAIRSAQLGLKTALVEREKVGGVCLHRGCIPTKSLLHSADLFLQMQRAAEYGITLDAASLKFDYPAVQARTTKIVAQLYKGIEYLLKKNNITVIAGHGHLAAPGKLLVNPVAEADITSHEITARHFILSSGSHWQTLDGISTQPQGAIIDPDGALNLAQLPASIAIVGAGQTGVEFASFFSAVGVKVYLLESQPQLLPLEDKEISTQIDRLLSRRKVDIYLNTTLLAQQVTENEGGVQLDLTYKNKPLKIQAEKLLVAVGRAGNIANLGLENIPNLQTAAGFITTDSNYLAAPGLYAIGDVTGGAGFAATCGGSRFMLAHAASAEGIFVAERLAGKHPDRPNYAAIPRCTYSHPQAASVGLTEAQARHQARQQGMDDKTAIKVGKFSYKANGRALMLGDSEGFVKLVASAQSGDLLGAHLCGTNAIEMIGEPGLATLLNGSVDELAQAVRPHPALSEVLMEAARDVDGWAVHI